MTAQPHDDTMIDDDIDPKVEQDLVRRLAVRRETTTDRRNSYWLGSGIVW